MAVREYIGARYVPLFSDPIEWDETLAYEPLTVVINQGNSYVSKQFVPAGTPLPTTAERSNAYWLLWADFNAQIEQYRAEVETYAGRINANAEAIQRLDGDLAAEILARTNADTSIRDDFAADLAAEATRINEALAAAVDELEQTDETLSTRIAATEFKNEFIQPINAGSFESLPYVEAYDANNVLPNLGQGFTLIGDSRGVIALAAAEGGNSMRVATVDFAGNTFEIGTRVINDVGHANQLCFKDNYIYLCPAPDTYGAQVGIRKYTLDWTLATIIAPPSTWTGVWWVVADRKTGDMYAISDTGEVGTFNGDTITPTGTTLAFPTESFTRQGAALFAGVVYAPIGGVYSGEKVAIMRFDIASGEYLGSYTMPDHNEIFPYGELEDIDFSSDGTMYIYSRYRAGTNQDLGGWLNLINKWNIGRKFQANYHVYGQSGVQIINLRKGNNLVSVPQRGVGWTDSNPQTSFKSLSEVNAYCQLHPNTAGLAVAYDENDPRFFGQLYVTSNLTVFMRNQLSRIVGQVKVGATGNFQTRQSRFRFSPLPGYTYGTEGLLSFDAGATARILTASPCAAVDGVAQTITNPIYAFPANNAPVDIAIGVALAPSDLTSTTLYTGAPVGRGIQVGNPTNVYPT